MFGHITKRLTAYHHGELSAEDRRRVEAHLAQCQGCRKESENIRHVVGVVSRGLNSHGALEAPATLSVTYAPETAGLRWVLVPSIVFLVVLTIGVYAWRQ